MRSRWNLKILSPTSRKCSILGYIWIWRNVSRSCPHTLCLLPISQNVDITVRRHRVDWNAGRSLSKPAGSNSYVSSYPKAWTRWFQRLHKWNDDRTPLDTQISAEHWSGSRQIAGCPQQAGGAFRKSYCQGQRISNMKVFSPFFIIMQLLTLILADHQRSPIAEGAILWLGT